MVTTPEAWVAPEAVVPESPTAVPPAPVVTPTAVSQTPPVVVSTPEAPVSPEAVVTEAGDVRTVVAEAGYVRP